jgi:hypothetical protein
MASFKERRDSLKNTKFKPVKILTFMMGNPKESNFYDVWYQPGSNLVSLYLSSDLSVPIMSMPYMSFIRPTFRMSSLRWPESVAQTAVNKWASLTKAERQKVIDSIPLNTFMLEQMPNPVNF